MYQPRTNEFLRAVAVEIKEWIPELKTCQPHDGRFSEREVKRFVLSAPAVLVACLGAVSIQDRGDQSIESVRQWAAFVLTDDCPGLTRGEAARNLVDALELLILRGIVRTDEDTGVRSLSNRWGLTGVGPAERVQSQNLYSGMIDEEGVALWAVTWRQTVRIPPLSEEEVCPIPTELYLGRPPEIGTGHEDDYERLS